MPFSKKIHSKAQSRLMQAKCHGANLKGGPSQAKACEMLRGYSHKKYSKLPERKGKR